MAYSQHPRLSLLSNSSLSSSDHLSPTASSTRFSLPSAPSLPPSTRPAAARPNVYDRPLNKSRVTDVSAAAFSFLFSELVQYTQKRVSGINDLERRHVSSPPPALLSTLPLHLGSTLSATEQASGSSSSWSGAQKALPKLPSVKSVFSPPSCPSTPRSGVRFSESLQTR
jgi:hypothetical protein